MRKSTVSEPHRLCRYWTLWQQYSKYNIKSSMCALFFFVSYFDKIFKIIHEFHVFKESRETLPVNSTHVSIKYFSLCSLTSAISPGLTHVFWLFHYLTGVKSSLKYPGRKRKFSLSAGRSETHIKVKASRIVINNMFEERFSIKEILDTPNVISELLTYFYDSTLMKHINTSFQIYKKKISIWGVKKCLSTGKQQGYGYLLTLPHRRQQHNRR